MPPNEKFTCERSESMCNFLLIGAEGREGKIDLDYQGSAAALSSSTKVLWQRSSTSLVA